MIQRIKRKKVCYNKHKGFVIFLVVKENTRKEFFFMLSFSFSLVVKFFLFCTNRSILVVNFFLFFRNILVRPYLYRDASIYSFEYDAVVSNFVINIGGEILAKSYSVDRVGGRV